LLDHRDADDLLPVQILEYARVGLALAIDPQARLARVARALEADQKPLRTTQRAQPLVYPLDILLEPVGAYQARLDLRLGTRDLGGDLVE
jgi:hypothetical protein